MKKVCNLLMEAALLWYDRDADYSAATVSYYTLFAVAPLLLLTVTMVGLVYGTDFMANELKSWGGVLGHDLILLLQSAVQNLSEVSKTIGVPIVGAIFFSGMIVIMCNSFTSGLHRMWGISHGGFKGWLKKSFNSVIFIIILEIYLFCIVTFYILFESISGFIYGPLASIFQLLLFLIITTMLFSLIYRILPSQSPRLRARLLGGFVAALLFAVAKVMVVWYVSFTPVPGLFGVAGLILVFLIWIYVSTSIVYFGAALAQVYDRHLS